MRFTPDRVGIAKIPITERGVHDAVFDAASAIVRVAIVLGPKRTGHYVQSIRAHRAGGPSPVATVVAADFKAHWIEWGAGPSRKRGRRPFMARHPLERAARGLGYRFVKAPKGSR